MKRILLGIVLLLLMVIVGCSQESEEPLRLTIKSDKEVYVLGEEIQATLIIKNIGEDKVKPYYILKDSFLAINGKEIALATWLIWRGNIEGYLPPNTEFSYSINVKKIYAIDKIGQYSLFWKYKNLTSNVITIKVVKEKK